MFKQFTTRVSAGKFANGLRVVGVARTVYDSVDGMGEVVADDHPESSSRVTLAAPKVMTEYDPTTVDPNRVTHTPPSAAAQRAKAASEAGYAQSKNAARQAAATARDKSNANATK